MKRIKNISTKKLAIIIDEKSVHHNQVEELLKPCLGYIDLVRIAVKPENVFNALKLAEKIKKMSFEVAFNVMYLSEWHNHKEIKEVLPELNNSVDYFYMVDSFGSIFPEKIKNIIQEIKTYSNINLGFHGHNNIELALINTLTALEHGVEIIDSTITGMGRGAGNLKTELLLSVLNKTKDINVNFNSLSEVTSEFEKLKSHHNWGTSLPYMVSGVRSFSQKEVMEWVTKKYYSINSVIRALNKKTNYFDDYKEYKIFSNTKEYKNALIIGGGPSVEMHINAIKEFVSNNNDLCVIHASSKNALPFKDIEVEQFFCLVGNEGLRMEKIFENLNGFYGTCILPPSPREMGTFVPKEIINNTKELSEINFTELVDDSHTAIALQTVINLKIEKTYFVGFDGYKEGEMKQKDYELFVENNNLFRESKSKLKELITLTPSNYSELKQESIYKILASK